MIMIRSDKKFLLLFLKIVLPIVLIVAISSYFFLKKVEDDKKTFMYEKVKVMAMLIETMYEFNKEHFSSDAESITVAQVQQTFNSFKDDKSINFIYMLGKRDKEYINFVASSDIKQLKHVRYDDKQRAQPMRDALDGFSTVLVNKNCKGEKVFSAFINISHTPWALVIEQSYAKHTQSLRKIMTYMLLISSVILLSLFCFLRYFEKKSSELIKNSEDRFKNMVESTSDMVWEVDINGYFTYSNFQVKNILGYEIEEILGKRPFDFMSDTESKRVEKLFEKIAKKRDCIVSLESVNVTKSGNNVVLLTNGTPFFNALGGLVGYRGITRDITSYKQYTNEIEQLAYFDALTGLANRRNIYEIIDKEIKYTLRHSTCSAVLFLDLDGFKYINDTFGHDCGDEVLKVVSKRLSDNLREFDSVGRIGGDEFVILIRGKDMKVDECHRYLQEVVDRLIKSVNERIHFEDIVCKVGISIGLSLIPNDGDNLEQILKNADSAMYKAKNSGKNCAVFS